MQEKSFINKQLGIKFTSYIDQKCCVWFKAKEVAEILGYKDTNQSIRKNVSENHKKKILLNQPVKSTGCSMTYLIDESGFYELFFKSRLPSAIIFREWVFTKVLPSIRKYGYYKCFDTRIKQRFIIDGKKYYKHQVFSNYGASKDGEIINVKTERILKMIKDRGGYLFFNICYKKLEKPKTYLQHRFVYEVFKGPIPRFFEVDHVNEIRSDNRIKNLQLLSHKRNVQKSKNRPIISIDTVTGKERRYISIKKAAIELDISATNISKVCRKKGKSLSSKIDGKKYLFKYLD